MLSEIGLSCADEETQALAAERLYRVCFSHAAMSGIFWWNLDDNGILCDKERNAAGENLPYGGLVRGGVPKAAYKVLDHLINEEWHTEGSASAKDGKIAFRGFFGKYRLHIKGDGMDKEISVDLGKAADRNLKIEL